MNLPASSCDSCTPQVRLDKGVPARSALWIVLIGERGQTKTAYDGGYRRVAYRLVRSPHLRLWGLKMAVLDLGRKSDLGLSVSLLC